MFLSNSRYADVPQAQATVRGAVVTVVRIRRLPAIDGDLTVVKGIDRLDIIADRKYADPTWFWHVGDANSELEAERLTAIPNRTIKVPPR